MESISNRTLTWAEHKELATETNTSAITDHVAKENKLLIGPVPNPRQRKSSEVTTNQRIYPHMQGGQLHEQRWGSLQPTYDL